MHSSALTRHKVSITRQSVFRRSLATQPAAATRPTVLMRSIATPRATTTRPSVLTPSYSTQSALLTQVSVLWRSSPTQPAATTWPSATGWLATPPARPTQLLVLVHSATTPSAAATSQWAFLPPVILPLAIITSTSAILVWQASPELFGLVRDKLTGPHLSPASVGATVPTGVAVIVDGSGHLGTTTSSARFKEAIKPMDEASEAILALKPVTFRYKHELDPDSIPQFGLVAEQVEKVNPDLVAGDDQGKPYTVRYEAVNAMLLNEFLKEHREVAELKSTVAEQRKGMEAMAAQLKAQASQIQKVSAQLEASRRAQQTVVSNP